MDNLSLEALVRELRPRLLNKPIRKIRSAGEHAFLLDLRSSASEILVLSLHASAPGLFITSQDWLSERAPSDAVLTLRKYLQGGRIIDVRKELADRVVSLDIENYRLSGRAGSFTLSLELIPNKAAGFLLDEQQKVLAVFPSQRESRLELGAPYQAPELKANHQVGEIRRELFQEWVSESQALAWKQVAGLSPIFYREALHRGRNNPEACWAELQVLLQQIQHGPYSPRIYAFEKSEGGSHGASPPKLQRVISPVALESFSKVECESFASMNDAAQALLRNALERAPEDAQHRSRLNSVAAALKKGLRLKEKLQADLQRHQQAANLKLYADLLYAQTGKPPRGIDKIRVVDLFDPQLAAIEIPLDPQASLIQNANRYSRLYQKANRSIPLIQKRLERLQAEIEALESEQKALRAEASGLEKGSVAQGTGAKRQTVQPRVSRRLQSEPRAATERSGGFSLQALQRKVAKSFVSSEGLPILVGKSSKDNDVLTLKIARNEDFWLHVAGYGGSHVILRNPQKLPAAPRQSLLEAAQLAAYFSQARNAPKVEVHYTQKRFVSKPKGAKAGLVRLKEYQSISAKPQLLSEVDDGREG